MLLMELKPFINLPIKIKITEYLNNDLEKFIQSQK